MLYFIFRVEKNQCFQCTCDLAMSSIKDLNKLKEIQPAADLSFFGNYKITF